MTAKLVNLYDKKGQDSASLLDALTPREREILSHLSRGESNKAIARTLDISHDTVKLHVRHILAKLNLSSRVEAAVFAVENRVAPGGAARGDKPTCMGYPGVALKSRAGVFLFRLYAPYQNEGSIGSKG